MKNNIEEEWRPVRGFEDYAEVSNLGQIHKFKRVIYFGTNHHSKRIQEEEWTYGYVGGNGYLYASIGNKKFRVNRLVYMTFVGDIPDDIEVNHLDENKHNNRLDNLNLLSHGDNVRYGTGIARMTAALTNHPQRSKIVQALDPTTMEVVYEFPSMAEAQRQGFKQSTVSKCCNGKRKTHKGLIWRYSEK